MALSISSNSSDTSYSSTSSEATVKMARLNESIIDQYRFFSGLKEVSNQPDISVNKLATESQHAMVPAAARVTTAFQQRLTGQIDKVRLEVEPTGQGNLLRLMLNHPQHSSSIALFKQLFDQVSAIFLQEKGPQQSEDTGFSFPPLEGRFCIQAMVCGRTEISKLAMLLKAINHCYQEANIPGKAFYLTLMASVKESLTENLHQLSGCKTVRANHELLINLFKDYQHIILPDKPNVTV